MRTNRHEIVDKIGIDAKRDNLERMFDLACLLGHTKMAEKLLAHGAKPQGKDDSGEPMRRAMFHLQWEMDDHYGFRSEFRARDALEPVIRLAGLGAHWQPSDSDLRRFRRNLYFFELNFSENLIKTFHQHNVCSPKVLEKLLTAPKMKTYLACRREALLKLVRSGSEKC